MGIRLQANYGNSGGGNTKLRSSSIVTEDTNSCKELLTICFAIDGLHQKPKIDTTTQFPRIVQLSNSLSFWSL
ncbi:hypothetical protein TcWFU_006143 [Taenia crassiceps]|uniref:Uncharacterized protein n=1 Tax=Taenia crassiceps TaxID=6207 RepID=A0ABR4Q416_9CEST